MSSPAPGRVASNPQPAPKPNRFRRWHQRVLGFCLVIFAFELGFFLLVFPWMRSWELNWVPVHSRTLSDIWMSRYFRGVVSGLGLLNIYIACMELIKQFRALFGSRE
jgi:hypothetical protein